MDQADRITEDVELQAENAGVIEQSNAESFLPDREMGDILTPGEVATMLRVGSKAVATWAKEGKLPHFKTPGGHRRFYFGDVVEAINKANDE